MGMSAILKKLEMRQVRWEGQGVKFWELPRRAELGRVQGRRVEDV
jgi:hypothetical protein